MLTTTRNGWTLDDGMYPALVSDCGTVFIRYYERTSAKGEHWQAYRTVEALKKGRKPWAHDNKRIGSEAGFQSLDECLKEAEKFKKSDQTSLL